ncbi:hypothetical protein EDF56_105517 [Novosphingobium sp. PhB165]|uniref:hypothetical protein n=1 Tax=Novosphingobium sp. PhB165 TaxID=2485105 RepID=UPI0010473E24|nr:hypothetical protein [Novosphingobium sp. PhB165]TCM18166.1 hypothetical protein EDF56_105517 [Novosphingobium sp. PhB165]
MNFNRVTLSCAALIAVNLAALPTPSLAQPAATPTAFERAMLSVLDAPTRAQVEKRAVHGNTVSGVIGTILLNNYYGAGARNPGQALSVAAVDFGRGTVIFRRAPNVLELQRFDPHTLRMIR